jgi:hypothetical protein
MRRHDRDTYIFEVYFFTLKDVGPQYGFVFRTLWDTSYGCEGVDLNRNWDWHWGGVGASRDPCSDTYAGSRAFSEPETRAVSDFLLDHRDRIQVN